MSSARKSFLNTRDAKLNSANKVTTLNPNAAEYFPSGLRSLPGDNKNVDVATPVIPEASGKAVLDQSASNISDNSDDEAHQYWCHQLPDDITPDFKGMGEELQVPRDLSSLGLSINDGIGNIGTSRFSMTRGGNLLGKRQQISPQGSEYKCFNERMQYRGLPFTENHPSTALMNLGTDPLDKQFMNGDQHFSNNREGRNYDGNLNAGFLNGSINERALLKNSAMNPVEFLATHFPGFAVESLAELYYANGCDVNLTIEKLTQHELQVDNNFSQKVNSRALSSSSLSEREFPALKVPDSQIGVSKYRVADFMPARNELQPIGKEDFSLFKSVPSGESVGAPDFVSAVCRLAPEDSEHWKLERTGTRGASTGLIINSQLLTSSHNRHAKTVLEDKLRCLSTSLAVSPWFETGDAMAQIYSEMREEDRDFAHLQNACFEQAKQGHTIGSKGIANELSVKGQLYNFQMKEAHEKAKELIYQQRNPVSQLQTYSQVQDPLMINLHGLHVNEAINVLKHDLSILRRTARSAGQRLQVNIQVGSGHHTRVSRSPVWLPIAVQQYLLDENLQFSEDQPGQLRVVIC